MRRALVTAAILAALAAPVRAETRSNAPHARPPAIRLDWAETPNADDLERDYPPEALDKGAGGDSRIECQVEPDGALVDCEILSETPQGLGFGPAAIRASRRFRMKPYPPALVHGGLPRVVIPVHWEVARTPEKAPPPRAAAASRPAFWPPLDIWYAVIPLVLVGLWLVAAGLVGLVSGWYGLRARYPDRKEPALARVGSLSGLMGIGVSLRAVLTLTACQSGLRVSIFRMVGPFCRPFFVPWRDISTRPVSILFWPMTRLSFGNPEVGVLSIDARAWERLAAQARKTLGSQVPPAYPVSDWRLISTTLLQWAVLTALAGAFLYFAPTRISPRAEQLPLAVCVGSPAIVFGIRLLSRYLRQRRRA